MTVLVFLFIGILLLVLQTSLLPLLPSWLGRPDLLFLLIVFLPSRQDPLRGAVTVFALGLLMDIFSGVFLGFYPITYLLIFFALKSLYRVVEVNESFYRAPVAACVYLVTAGAMFLAIIFFGQGNRPVWSWGAVLLQTLLVAIMAMPLFIFFDYCWHLATRPPTPRWRRSKRRRTTTLFGS